jgi:hypothetical protein
MELVLLNPLPFQILFCLIWELAHTLHVDRVFHHSADNLHGTMAHSVAHESNNFGHTDSRQHQHVHLHLLAAVEPFISGVELAISGQVTH